MGCFTSVWWLQKVWKSQGGAFPPEEGAHLGHVFRGQKFSVVASCGTTYERAMFPEIMVQINFDALPCMREKTFLVAFVFGTRYVPGIQYTALLFSSCFLFGT